MSLGDNWQVIVHNGMDCAGIADVTAGYYNIDLLFA